MIWVALKIGFIIPAVLQDPSAIGAMTYVQDREISLPSSTYTNHEFMKTEWYIHVVIDESGKTEVEGKLLPNKKKIEFLKNLRYEQPQGVPIFIVDKETPMEFVTQMIQYIREAGFEQIRFSTSKENKVQTGT